MVKAVLKLVLDQPGGSYWSAEIREMTPEALQPTQIKKATDSVFWGQLNCKIPWHSYRF